MEIITKKIKELTIYEFRYQGFYTKVFVNDTQEDVLLCNTVIQTSENETFSMLSTVNRKLFLCRLETTLKLSAAVAIADYKKSIPAEKAEKKGKLTENQIILEHLEKARLRKQSFVMIPTNYEQNRMVSKPDDLPSIDSVSGFDENGTNFLIEYEFHESGLYTARIHTTNYY
jgi:phosphopantothenoylcysteine synthetase/decarboxylase